MTDMDVFVAVFELFKSFFLLMAPTMGLFAGVSLIINWVNSIIFLDVTKKRI